MFMCEHYERLHVHSTIIIPHCVMGKEGVKYDTPTSMHVVYQPAFLGHNYRSKQATDHAPMQIQKALIL